MKAATAGRSGSGMEPARCCFIPDRPAGHINGPSYRLKNRLAAVDLVFRSLAGRSVPVSLMPDGVKGVGWGLHRG